MRMSCDSTYLLDQRTDFGVKADELATLLDELLEQPGSKVVVFSQWVRMLELLVRRLKKKRLDHVLFHGGVDGTRRSALIDRFREHDRCRVFLSTDAGGVGLNLQDASIVVNMDLPWNPAVLEQRIGRVHRLGQRKPVHVINFIAEGTIEEGMLSVLAFKKSLFAGVLDGGAREVFLSGSRLSRFMDAVERTTATIPQPRDINGDGARDAKPRVDPKPPEAPEPRIAAATTAPATDLASGAVSRWDALVHAGVALLDQLAAAATHTPTDPRADGLRFVHRDPRVCRSFAGADPGLRD
jgi:superfamily II DNA/RNA helicase